MPAVTGVVPPEEQRGRSWNFKMLGRWSCSVARPGRILACAWILTEDEYALWNNRTSLLLRDG